MAIFRSRSVLQHALQCVLQCVVECVAVCTIGAFAWLSLELAPFFPGPISAVAKIF